jgi:AcrR family transcriptional regulator
MKGLIQNIDIDLGDFNLAKDTRQLILDISRELFDRQGYTATSMREIASACGITVGNLCYYFKKKEELLMAYHNKLYSSFSSHLPEKLSELDPWCSYIAAEYCFLYKCAETPPIRKLYLDVINVPSLRVMYHHRHHELFLSFLSSEQFEAGERELFFSTVIASSIEYHMMEQYDVLQPEINFDTTFSYVFGVRMHLLKVPEGDQKRYWEQGCALGKKIIRNDPSLMDL